MLRKEEGEEGGRSRKEVEGGSIGRRRVEERGRMKVEERERSRPVRSWLPVTSYRFHSFGYWLPIHYLFIIQQVVPLKY